MVNPECCDASNPNSPPTAPAMQKPAMNGASRTAAKIPPAIPKTAVPARTTKNVSLVNKNKIKPMTSTVISAIPSISIENETCSASDVYHDPAFQVTLPSAFAVNVDLSVPVPIVKMGFAPIVGADVAGASAEESAETDSDFLVNCGLSVPVVNYLDGEHDNCSTVVAMRQRYK